VGDTPAIAEVERPRERLPIARRRRTQRAEIDEICAELPDRPGDPLRVSLPLPEREALLIEGARGRRVAVEEAPLTPGG
jgi:hypothetical protein